MTDRFQVACRAAGVPVLAFHELQHSVASMMAAAGVPMAQAKERLLHWAEAMTETYTHVGSESARQVGRHHGLLLRSEIPSDDGGSVIPLRRPT